MKGRFVVIRYCMNCDYYYEVYLNTDEDIQQAMMNGEEIYYVEN